LVLWWWRTVTPAVGVHYRCCR